ncbi:MAG: hypothetical protein N2234_04510 [Planctomycetota bacterium]|nr:hypothetical protein [Planctomycetota bacterium]
MLKKGMVILTTVLVLTFLAAQEPTQPKQPPPDKQPEPEKETSKIKLFISITDFKEKEEYKWRLCEFIVKETFLLASVERKEEFVKKRVRQWKKSKEYKETSEEELVKKAEENWEKLRKERRLDAWDYSHIEILDLKKEQEKLNKEKKEGEEEKTLTENDLRKMADFIIEGEAKSEEREKSTFLGHTVAYTAEAFCKVKVVDAKLGKVIKEFEKKHRISAEEGQDEAHNRALQAVGFSIATELVKLDVFKKGAKQLKEETPEPQEKPDETPKEKPDEKPQEKPDEKKPDEGGLG